MLIETLSVREAREQLTSVLERLRNGDRTPVGVGSHRKTEAIMLPAEVFAELMAERGNALAQAIGSVQAEGLEIDEEARATADRWVRGEISAAQMRELIRQQHRQ